MRRRQDDPEPDRSANNDSPTLGGADALGVLAISTFVAAIALIMVLLGALMA